MSLQKNIRSLVLSILCIGAASEAGAASIARRWNDMLLQAVRYDYARPTVTARNLFHMSIVLYDSWSIYEKTSPNYHINFKRESSNPDADRNVTTSYAAYRFLLKRFAKAPKFEQIKKESTELMRELGLNPDDTTVGETPIGTGNMIAGMVLSNFMHDGSLEDKDYVSPPENYAPLNSPLIVNLPSVGTISDINFWQPLALDFSIGQGGFPIANKVQSPLTLHWGSLAPFALTASDRNPNTQLYLDPGPPS